MATTIRREVRGPRSEHEERRIWWCHYVGATSELTMWSWFARDIACPFDDKRSVRIKKKNSVRLQAWHLTLLYFVQCRRRDRPLFFQSPLFVFNTSFSFLSTRGSILKNLFNFIVIKINIVKNLKFLGKKNIFYLLLQFLFLSWRSLIF